MRYNAGDHCWMENIRIKILYPFFGQETVSIISQHECRTKGRAMKSQCCVCSNVPHNVPVSNPMLFFCTKLSTVFEWEKKYETK